MNTKLKWILIFCTLVVLIGGAYVAYDQLAPMIKDLRGGAVSESAASAEDSEQAFMVPNVGIYDAEGNLVSLPDLIDKPTILNFWAVLWEP